MSTRSITVVKDKSGNKIIEMYRHYDGYPESHGQELIDFINSGDIIKGIGVNRTDRKQFNGITSFAIQLVQNFNASNGGFYLHPPITRTMNIIEYGEIYGAEYYYEIDCNLNLKCWYCYGKVKKIDLVAKQVINTVKELGYNNIKKIT